jgi:chemotaxis protein methyltransferase CheR
MKQMGSTGLLHSTTWMNIQALSLEDVEYVCDLVRKYSGIVLDSGKAYLVQSRLELLSHQEGCRCVADLILKLRWMPPGPLHRKVVEVLTTNETSFFRDLAPFQALREYLIPDIMAKNAALKRINIWSGASSSGQEAYSIMFTILDHFPALKGWRVRCLATDISKTMVDRGREGIYGPWEVRRGLPSSVLDKFFYPKGTGWQVRKEVRDMIEFREMNLVGPWLPFPKMDLVFLRNVLMYFDAPTKKTILRNMQKVLEPRGYLVLGGSETTMNLDERYEPVSLDGISVFRIREEEAHGRTIP